MNDTRADWHPGWSGPYTLDSNEICVVCFGTIKAGSTARYRTPSEPAHDGDCTLSNPSDPMEDVPSRHISMRLPVDLMSRVTARTQEGRITQQEFFRRAAEMLLTAGSQDVVKAAASDSIRKENAQ